MPYRDRKRRLQYLKEYRRKNLVSLKQKRDLQRDRIQAVQNLRRKNNPEKVRSAKRDWRRRNYRGQFKVRILLSSRVTKALKGVGQKSARTLELLGMELPEFRIYLQGQFRPGMTWENHGPVWHVDHIRPCASFNLSDPGQQKVCFRWDNFQPLFAKENLKKGAKYA